MGETFCAVAVIFFLLGVVVGYVIRGKENDKLSTTTYHKWHDEDDANWWKEDRSAPEWIGEDDDD